MGKELGPNMDKTVGMRQRSWLSHYATSRKVAGSIPDEVIGFLNWTNPSRTMALGSTQPLRDLSTRYLPGYKGRSARMAENFTAICEPRRLTTLLASADSFCLLY
jgi:hypothetical protein